MKPTKPSANERRLAKLLNEADERCIAHEIQFADQYEAVAGMLAHWGVLAVCAAPVPDADEPRGHRPGCLGWGHRLRLYLRRLARGPR